MQNWGDVDSALQDECCDSKWSTNFVCADSRRSCAKRCKIKGNFSKALDCIGVHWNVASERNNFGNRLNCANLIVGVHDADQRNMFALCLDDFSERIKIN